MAAVGTVMVAATMSLAAVTPAAAAPGQCFAWRLLKFGDTGLEAVVEPGAPWHVRLGTNGNGYQLFQFCEVGPSAGKTRITIKSNANWYLTERPDRRVTADGGMPVDRDYWFVCALDAKWVEISFLGSGHYLGRNSSGYLTTRDDTPNGNTLWRRSEFNGITMPSC